MRIAELCTRDVVCCDRQTGVVEVAQLMRDHHVGDVIVVDRLEGGRVLPVGIVTDRDLVVQLIAKGVAADALTAGDLLTGGELVTATDVEDVYDGVLRMRARGVRRLPVVDSSRVLVGVLTADDVTEFLAQELTEVARIVPRQLKIERDALAPVASPGA